MEGHRWGLLGLALIAVVFDVAALVVLLVWWLSGDWLFGHYQGPAYLLVSARILGLLGLLTGIAWFAYSIRISHVNLLVIALLLLLSLPPALITMEWVFGYIPRRGGPNPDPFNRPPDWKPDARGAPDDEAPSPPLSSER
jgi:hypothetical protein